MGKFLSLMTLLLTAVFAAGTASAQSTAAAKKEGKAVIYGSLESDTMEAISKAFTKKTGIEVDYWRAVHDLGRRRAPVIDLDAGFFVNAFEIASIVSDSSDP